MNWDAIGAIAELMSAVMVALSLVYLAMQVRAFRRQADIELDMHFVENADRIRSETWTNPEVASFMERCQGPSGSLSPVERRRYAAYLNQRLWTFVQLFRYKPDAWLRVRSGLGAGLSVPVARETWTEMRGQFPPEFRNEIDALLASFDSLP